MTVTTATQVRLPPERDTSTPLSARLSRDIRYLH
jgi:hypothetical protein